MYFIGIMKQINNWNQPQNSVLKRPNEKYEFWGKNINQIKTQNAVLKHKKFNLIIHLYHRKHIYFLARENSNIERSAFLQLHTISSLPTEIEISMNSVYDCVYETLYFMAIWNIQVVLNLYTVLFEKKLKTKRHLFSKTILQ